MGWLKTIISALGGFLWLVIRFFKRRDAAEPGRKREEIGTAITNHDETKINELLENGLHKRPPAA
jgi:hypothetical protein